MCSAVEAHGLCFFGSKGFSPVKQHLYSLTTSLADFTAMNHSAGSWATHSYGTSTLDLTPRTSALGSPSCAHTARAQRSSSLRAHRVQQLVWFLLNTRQSSTTPEVITNSGSELARTLTTDLLVLIRLTAAVAYISSHFRSAHSIDSSYICTCCEMQDMY
jgi:hypothetical protein